MVLPARAEPADGDAEHLVRLRHLRAPLEERIYKFYHPCMQVLVMYYGFSLNLLIYAAERVYYCGNRTRCSSMWPKKRAWWDARNRRYG